MRPVTGSGRLRAVSYLTACIAGLALVSATAHSQAQTQSPPTNGERKVSAGVFTPAQATRGENAYKVNCVSCHATSDYMGETFQLAWLSRTAFDIFDVIRSQMPEDNPGILARQEYVDIVAYIFSLNRYPAGSADLPGDDDSLKKVRIDAPPPKFGSSDVRTGTVRHPIVGRPR
jgi:mono/diheme cytochrome c family protein